MILITEKTTSYELLDSGDGEKLERFGSFTLRRPDPEVLWKKLLPDTAWSTAHAYFSRSASAGKWKTAPDMPTEWMIELDGVKVNLELGSFKHVGLFPEQLANWTWMRELITNYTNEIEFTNKKPTVLNLFGYTGVASALLAQTSAEITHVDSIQSTIDKAKNNAKLNNISNIRFIVEDARKFVEREIKRGKKYDAILLDPPVYGKGTKKEQWNISEDLLPLLDRVTKLLSEKPLFVAISGYASEYSHVSYQNALRGALTKDFPKAKIESGELAIKESNSGRLLPAGIFARASF
jgi:23S rRNA (cytosine1962-C5)-methyltransferase